MTLDEAVFIEDAIKAHEEGCTREEYVAMHTPSKRDIAGMEFDAAIIEIDMRGSARKALNFVKGVIETYR